MPAKNDAIYRLTDVLQVVGISEQTATNWSRREILTERYEIASSGRGRGRERHVNLRTVVMLSLMKLQIDDGVTAHRAALNAAQVMMALRNDSGMSTYTFEITNGRDQFTSNWGYPDDDRNPEAEGLAPLYSRTLHVQNVVERVKALLAYAAKAPAPVAPLAKPRRRR